METTRTRLTLLPIVLPLLLSALALATFTQRARATDPAAVRFADRTVTTAAGTFGYQVFVPTHWNGRRPVAMVLFLHGPASVGPTTGRRPKMASAC